MHAHGTKKASSEENGSGEEGGEDGVEVKCKGRLMEESVGVNGGRQRRKWKKSWLL